MAGKGKGSMGGLGFIHKFTERRPSSPPCPALVFRRTGTGGVQAVFRLHGTEQTSARFGGNRAVRVAPPSMAVAR